MTAYQLRLDQTYRYILRYRSEHGYSPNLREIMAATGVSSTATQAYRLQSLERRGLLQYIDFRIARCAIPIVLGHAWDHGKEYEVTPVG